jgi:hypothetical protein
MLRHLLIAGLWAAGLMSILLLGGSLIPPQIWIAALYPGMIMAELLFSVLPTSVIESLMRGLDVEEAPALYASMSVVCAFLFWWLCAFVAIKVRARLLKNWGVGRMAASSRFR